MDSLTQIALGSAVGVAAMGRRTAVWKAALWGGLCGTLPDLDALIDHGDPIRNMTLHRTESHSLFFLTLLAPAVAGVIAAIHRDRLFRRWWLAVWLVLITHPLLDLMTVYGTQLGLPFTDFPYYVGSIFIIDPLYTLPLMAGVALALARGEAGLRWNRAGLTVSTVYLAWSVGAQFHVTNVATAALARSGVVVERLLVTPTAFNTVLWRIVAMTPDGYVEGFHSLFDADDRIPFTVHPNDRSLALRQAQDWHVARLVWFSHGFFGADPVAGGLRIRDLRMGQEPTYTFSFVLPRPAGPGLPSTPPSVGAPSTASAGVSAAPAPALPRQLPMQIDVAAALSWLWQRLLGNRIPPLGAPPDAPISN